MAIPSFIIQINDTTTKWFSLVYPRLNKRHSPKWVINTLAAIGCLIFIATIALQISMIRAFRQQEGSHDVPHNPWIPATINGLGICLYVVLLPVLVLSSIRTFSKKMAIFCCSFTAIGYILLDIGVIFYHPLRLLTKCSLSDFNGIMRNCRAEFNDVLMVIRRGSTPISLIILGVLHGLVITLSLALLVRNKQVKYEINGRGNGHATALTPQENCIASENIELKNTTKCDLV